MEITRIEIARRWSSQGEPFRAQVHCAGEFNVSITVQVDEHRTLQLIELIEDLILDATREQIDSLRERQKALITAREPAMLEATKGQPEWSSDEEQAVAEDRA